MKLAVRVLFAFVVPVLFICLTQCLGHQTRQSRRQRSHSVHSNSQNWRNVGEPDDYHAETRIIYDDDGEDNGEEEVLSRPNRRRHRTNSRAYTQVIHIEEDNAIVENNNQSEPDFPRNCSSCWLREEVKKLRIETIKAQILSKLRLKAPPNITNKSLPRIPSLNRLMQEIDHYDMQSDQAHIRNWRATDSDSGDDFYAKTTKVMNVAEIRKYLHN